MSQQFIDDQVYKGKDFTDKALAKGDYENCEFIDCNFSGSKLNYLNFIDCIFKQCDLTNVILTETGIKENHFDHCKMIGLRFESCNDFLFAAIFQNCRLDFSTFHQMNLQKVTYKDCSLIEVDFEEANLSGVSFNKSNLDRANFLQSNLEKADFRNAINFSIDPQKNQIRNAKFSVNGLIGLLRKYDLDLEF